VASALGLLVAPARVDRAATFVRALAHVDWDTLEAAYAALEADAAGVIAQTLSTSVLPALARLADMRFQGQGFEVVTRLPAGPYTAASEPALRAAFEQAYGALFARRPPVAEIELVNIRACATAMAGRGELALELAPAGPLVQPRATRTIALGQSTAPQMAPVYERSALPAGMHVDGPALIEEASSTLFVPTGAAATVQASGNIVVELPPG
jgi:N-methylhydantoinase A